MKNSANALGVFLLGSAVGAALGILFAPDAGVEMRDLIASKAKDGLDTLKEKLNDGEQTFDQYKDKAENYAEKTAADAKSKVKDKADKMSDKIQDA